MEIHDMPLGTVGSICDNFTLRFWDEEYDGAFSDLDL